ncbi:fructosamine kinase family protein [Actinotalea sp. K2]|uniref:fructosamine kinase family protein n=1 Tax=Actinotalea sp. K2 TaxID=2939438 RepID=UPI002017E4A5|nr:fructosamine kinase family protein [Actinotalea sp. K2]MCL3861921.1 fructosamine kinase family protein [Actinotalea sp. K2]
MTTPVYRKGRADAPPGYFDWEAAGLAWLAVPGGPRVVRVLAVTEAGLELEHVSTSAPSRAAATDLGQDLARMHEAGAGDFGSPPDGWVGDGYFGPLAEPLPLLADAAATWGPFYADSRLGPVGEMLAVRGRLDPDLRTDLTRLRDRLRAGEWEDDEPPARVHGDLWAGNLLWTDGGVVLIDPAAHGGHPLTDLAMLDLFGLAHLDAVLDAYEQEHRLVDGWRDLLGLHQVFPLAVHAVLFGGSYVHRTAALVHRWAHGR